VLAVLLASSAKPDQLEARALTAALDTILTEMWPALHVRQERSHQVRLLQASMTAQNVGLELMLRGDHLSVLHAMLEGMVNRLDLASVLPA
jgi:hypothetical protein